MSELQTWDEFLDDGPAAAAGGGALPLLQDGTHIGTIEWAGYQDKTWAKSDRNQTGSCLTVKISFPGHREVWESIPRNQAARVQALCSAARVDPPKRGEPWDHTALKGAIVSVQTVLGISKAGNEYVRIEKFHPGPKTLPEEVRKAPPRKPAASTPAWEKDSNDIPF